MNHTLDIEDKAQLVAYLRSQNLIDADEAISTNILAGGVSNRTMLVTRADGTQWVVKQALQKLRVAVDWFSDPIRIHRESAALRWLGNVLPPNNVPALVFDDEDNHVIGMTAIPQPHENWKVMLLRGDIDHDLVKQFGEILATLHTPTVADDPALTTTFADRSFFESLRVEPYYGYTASVVSEASGFLNALIETTRTRQSAIVHGDYSPKNVLVYQAQLVILDFEVIHLGDPAFDIGFSMTHLLSKAHHVASKRQEFLDAAQRYWQTYIDVRGEIQDAEFEDCAVRHTLACLLARVAGRSPLEYLDAKERAHQKQIVLGLMADVPASMSDLITAFGSQLDLP